MSYTQMSNEQLLAEGRFVVDRELETIIDSILYFCEIVRRNLHISGAQASLFLYLSNRGYTRDQALVRKNAILLLIELPELKGAFLDRRLKMSPLHHMRQIFRREQKRRSKLKIEPLTHERKLQVARKLMQNSSRDTRRMLAEEFPECHGSREQTRPVANGCTEITFVCTEDEFKQFEALKDYWGHTNHERSWQVFFADLAFEAMKKWKANGASINLEKIGTPEVIPYQKARTRYRSVHVERFVRERAGHRCESIDEATGERCSCTHALEVDHVIPLAHGGIDHLDNMRMLCGPHNRYAAWKVGLRRPKEKLMKVQ